MIIRRIYRRCAAHSTARLAAELHSEGRGAVGGRGCSRDEPNCYVLRNLLAEPLDVFLQHAPVGRKNSGLGGRSKRKLECLGPPAEYPAEGRNVILGVVNVITSMTETRRIIV